ncbi:MAG: cupin domain-containing protein [Solirubrobacteraceae bacterium]
MSAVPRRIVTGHDASGKSVVLSDAPTPKTLDIGTAAFHEVWITSRTPAPIAATEPEPTDRPVRTPPPADGVTVRFTEMAPGAEAPMHRTETVDVGVVLDGETWLLLDDGSETRVGPGDAVVQRGTNHAWANRSDRPVRMVFVMIDGTITDELEAATGPLEFFDQVLE